MKHIFGLLFATSLILTSCTKEDTPNGSQEPTNGKKILEFTADPGYVYYSRSENWIFANDINGKLLAAKSFKLGDKILLQTENDIPGNLVSITFLSIPSPKTYSLETWLGIEPGQDWTLKLAPFPPIPPTSSLTKKFTVNVSEFTKGSTWSISGNNKVKIPSADYVLSNLKVPVDAYDNQEKFLVFVNQGTAQIPKYKWLNNVTNGSTVNLSYSTMDNFDKTLTVSFPPTKMWDVAYDVLAGEASEDITNPFNLSYRLNYNNGLFDDLNNTRSNITLGFLDALPLVNTYLCIGIDSAKYSYIYDKKGSRPDNISFPLDASFTFPNKSISDFQVQSNKSYTMRSSFWSYDQSGSDAFIYWYVKGASQASQLVKELPKELVAKYPELSVDKLVYKQTDFTMSGETYEQVLDKTFRGKTPNKLYEKYNVIVKDNL